jgi:hypothetical protein
MVMDGKTMDIIAAVLTIPVAEKVIERRAESKHGEFESQEVVEIFFRMRKMVKRRYDETG